MGQYGIGDHYCVNRQVCAGDTQIGCVKDFLVFIVELKGNWYAFGYDHIAGENRIFALSRFRNIKITAEKFTVPEGFDISKEVDLSFGIWHNKEAAETYELLFDKGMANYILEREWHKDQVMEQKEDGSVYLKFSSNQKQQILSWVLGFGAAVTVLAPESLKQDVVESVQAVMAKYR